MPILTRRYSMALAMAPAMALAFFLAAANAALAAPPAAAADTAGSATLLIPEQIGIAAINGIEQESSSVFRSRRERSIELQAGRHDILAYYHELWPLVDIHDTLISNPVRFTLDVTPGQRYRIDYPQPQTHAEAERLEASFNGWIENLQTGVRVASVESGMRFRRGFTGHDLALVAINPSGGATGAVPPVTHAAKMPATANGSLEDMQRWWTHATPEQRQAFLSWISR